MRRLAVALLSLVGACGGANPDTGITAHLRLSTGQFVSGPITPDNSAIGPSVFLNLGNVKVYPGAQNLPLGGNVQGGTSVLVGLADDSGHWIVPAPIRDVLEEDSYLFSSRMSFSPTFQLAPRC